ncbi:MAG: LD-carboxypeptidase [Polyangiaceae bacterium]|nr:LD-carboxypeptidase [Polyangiaceae bacterium]
MTERAVATSCPSGLRLPPPLKPGDRIAVIAPSSPFEAVLGWRGLGFLASRYRLRFDHGGLRSPGGASRGIFSRTGYLAGDDERRRLELEEALCADDIRAIIAARGGYGALRFCDELPWGAFAERPKWIVGFSDITALHVEATRVGVASLHAPHLTALGRSDAVGRAAFIDALEQPGRARRVEGLSIVAAGRASGPLAGGNLTLLHACAAAGRLALPDRAVLFLEDVTERPYRIDRMLTTLVRGRHLERVAAVALGDFTECAPGPDGVTVESVLAERLAPLRVPVVAGVPSGHGRRNDPLLLGGVASLDAAGPHGALTISGGA